MIIGTVAELCMVKFMNAGSPPLDTNDTIERGGGAVEDPWFPTPEANTTAAQPDAIRNAATTIVKNEVFRAPSDAAVVGWPDMAAED